MFFWNSLAFSMIQRMLAIWSLVPLPFLKPADRMWCSGEGNGKPRQYSCLENPMNSMKRQNDRAMKDEPPRSVDAQYASGDQWRNNSRKNEGMGPTQKQHPVVVWLVIEARSDAVKSNIAQEPGMSGPWIKAKESEMPYWGCSLKNDRMISVHFQGKPFSIPVIQICAPDQ